jgi:hypothetical protein
LYAIILSSAAAFFTKYPALLNLLVPWIRRELEAILEEDTEILKEYILSVLRKWDLQSQESVKQLEYVLFNDAEQFVQELASFCRSPLGIEAYDEVADYTSS